MIKDQEMVDTMEEGSKRRVWSDAMKRQLVAETAAPGQSVSIVARRHDLNANLLFKWRRLMRAAGEPVGLPGLLPVTVAASPAPCSPTPSSPVSGSIEIDLGDGRRVRAEGSVDPGLMRVALEALVGMDRRR